MTSYQEINVDNEDGVSVITLDNGKVNAFSHTLIDEMNHALDEAERRNDIIILTGKAGIFSGGFDLKVMQSGIEAASALVQSGSKLARRLLSFPTPVITACSGHAVAKGAFILLASDVRIGADGPFKIGLNEVNIGMTMHYAGIEIAKARLPDSFFTRSVLCAEMFSPPDAVSAGFLDKVVAAESLMSEAMALANHFKDNMDLHAHQQTKLKARHDYLSRLDDAIDKDTKGIDFNF
ncbi:crotonase/enoyl-CoA hydratase family protein [Alteromonas sediminis]|uniref:Crotonase/enoyl-CoA hydratase family protein n=1 Tax=Alteromonas sediminis TaxID=2259342 RepID=A0A3N5ZBX5_9ALTE|nr:crotonase/enoyl-CoA hydratase family protein [Alteromonas sediminis]RPJ67228.1 crotonase/enoyl-CoA hydratase family protein [Alteromonas sediminis]